MSGVQLPHQGKYDAGQNGAPEDERATAAPPGPRVVGDVSDYGINECVEEAGNRPQEAHEARVHSQTEIQNDWQGADGGRLQIVGEHAQAVRELLHEGQAILDRRFIMFRFFHMTISLLVSQRQPAS